LAFEEPVSKAEQTESSEWTLQWALEQMSCYGVLPTDVYLMTVAEVNLFIVNRSAHEAEVSIASSWRTINFLGAFMSDKFQNLEKYLPDTKKRKKERADKKESIKQKITKIGRR
jgi:hypothetical protein